MRKAYRVDGKHEFVIDYVEQSDGTFKIYAPICPRDPHGNDSNTHHRYASGEICVAAGCEPDTLDRAEAIAKYWAEKYSAYVTTGIFSDTGGKVSV